MKDVLVDIGIIIEYLKSGKGILPTIYEKYKMKITSVTFAELLASSTFKDANLEREVMEFCKKYFEVVSVDQMIGLEVARIMRTYELNLAASSVAAAAKAMNIPLVTDDKKTYQRVEGLVLLEN